MAATSARSVRAIGDLNGRTIGFVARLLIAEDDDGIRAPLVRALEREGYDVEAVGDGAEAVRRALAERPDLLLLDIGLPGVDGLEICRRVRDARPDVPILLLTAQSSEIDTVVGLDAGADDYIAKPFRLSELMARVRAQLRRTGPTQVEAGDVRIDPGARRAWVADREIELTPKEFDLLALLIAHRGRVVRREEIMSAVWDENWFGSTKTLDVHMGWLRRKLGDDPAQPRFIHTVRGVGFRFEAP